MTEDWSSMITEVTDKPIEAYSFEDRVTERAKEQGCEIVYAEEDELQLDIDTEEAYKYFNDSFSELKERLKYFNSLILLTITQDKTSKGGVPGRHITVKVTGVELKPLERVALQFALHSDFKREFLNTARLLTGSTNSICFFEKMG